MIINIFTARRNLRFQGFLIMSLMSIGCIWPKPSLAQNNKPSNPSQDYFNRDIQKGQLNTTTRFLNFLEEGNMDSIYAYCDSSLFINDTTARTKIRTAIREIKKYKPTTERSEGVIVYEDNHDVYRCSYYTKGIGEMFAIDLHYIIGKAKSKVVAIRIKLDTQLTEERKENKEYEKKHPGPPPPPPPSTVH
jgi:hypothetical protein